MNAILMGTRGQKLDPGKFTYVLKEESEKVEGNDKGEYRTSTLTFTLPDGQPLIVAYKYKYAGVLGTNGPVENSASVNGKWSDDNNSSVTVQESSAGVNLKGITLVKVDAANQGKKLAGAEFTIYYWKNGSWAEGPDGLSVKNDGQLALSEDTANITYNVAYKLVETKAPSGYEVSGNPYYFIIPNSDETNYPVSKPSSEQLAGQKITLHTHNDGDGIYFPNTKSPSGPELPETGGVGTEGFVAGGLLATTIAMGGLALALRDKTRTRR